MIYIPMKAKQYCGKNWRFFMGFYGASYTAGELQTAYELDYADTSDINEKVLQNAHEAHPEIQIEHIFAKRFTQKGVSPSEELSVHAGQFFRILFYRLCQIVRRCVGIAGRFKIRRQKSISSFPMPSAYSPPANCMRSAFDHYFDDIFISSDFGIKKPDPGFFNQLIEKHRIAKDTAVMIGNDGRCDILGARSAGIASVYIHSNLSPDEPLPPADYILASMDMSALHQILLFKIMLRICVNPGKVYKTGSNCKL